MADTGFLLCGTAVSNGNGDKAWTSASNVTTVANEASCTSLIGTGDYTDFLKCTNFGFSIPTGSTINGIEMLYKVRANNSTDMVRDRPYLVIGGTRSTTNAATTYGTSLTATATDYTQGSPTDKWVFGGGSVPTVAQINSSDFGVEFQFFDDGSGSGDSTWVTYVYLKVYYTAPAGGGNDPKKHGMFFGFGF